MYVFSISYITTFFCPHSRAPQHCSWVSFHCVYLLLCSFLCVDLHATTHVWKLKNNSQKLVLSFLQVGPRARTQVFSPVCKQLSPPNHLTGIWGNLTRWSGAAPNKGSTCPKVKVDEDEKCTLSGGKYSRLERTKMLSLISPCMFQYTWG